MIPQTLKNQRTQLVLVLLLALILRLAGIASRPIWYDEAFSILLAGQSPPEIINGTLALDSDSSAAEEHPPAYYFLLWGWMKIFGNSLIAARMLSILASLGVVYCVSRIANHLFDPPTAVAAGLTVSILPFQIHYGQEIRMYGLLAFFLSLATLALLKRQWILFSVSAALAQYTHTLAAFYLIPLAFTPIFQRDWKTLRHLTVAGFASIILYSPWLIHLPAQLTKVTSSFWAEKPGVEKSFTLILMYLPHLPLPNNLLLPALLSATLIVTLAFFQMHKAFALDAGLQTVKAPAQSGLWLAYISFIPPLLLWLVSQFSPIYVERALLPSHVMFCIWLAWASTKTSIPRPIQILAFGLILISAGMGYFQHIAYTGFPYGPFASINKNIQSEFQEGDIVIHSSKLSYLPSFYFNRELPQIFIIDPPGSPTDTLSPTTQEVLGLSHQDNIASATMYAKRVWYVIYQQSIDEFIAQGLSAHPDIEYLNDNLTFAFLKTFEDIKVYLYIRSAP